MYFSFGLLFSRVNRLKCYKSFVKLISSANQEIVFENDTLLDGLEIDAERREKNFRVAYSSTHFEAISKYFESKTCLQDIKCKVPPHFLLRTYKCPHCLYFIDKDVARHVFKKLKPHLELNKSHILEVNAGAGVLTGYLLKSNLPRLRIYEADTSFYNELYVAILKHKNDARVFKFNLLKLWAMMRLDRNDNENRVDAAFDGLPFLSWEDEPVVKIISIIPSDRFILHIIQSIIFRSGICAYGRPELYLTMLSRVYLNLTATPETGFKYYRSKSVLFQLFFETEVLKSIPKDAILPWMKKPESFVLVKLTPRQDLFQKIPPHLIKPFWFFVRVFMQKRADKVIAVIERWMPGAGVRLISQGFTIYTECGSLTPEQILDLFKQFSSWPEYEFSSFNSSMEGLVVRMSDPGEAEGIMTEADKGVKEEESSDDLEKKISKLSS